MSSSFYVFFALKRCWLHLLLGEKVFLLKGSAGKIETVVERQTLILPKAREEKA